MRVLCAAGLGYGAGTDEPLMGQGCGAAAGCFQHIRQWEKPECTQGVLEGSPNTGVGGGQGSSCPLAVGFGSGMLSPTTVVSLRWMLRKGSSLPAGLVPNSSWVLHSGLQDELPEPHSLGACKDQRATCGPTFSSQTPLPAPQHPHPNVWDVTEPEQMVTSGVLGIHQCQAHH